MTPGAGTAHVVGRVACRWMRAGRRLNVVLWRLSGRHKWRPYVCGRLNAVSRRLSGRHGWRPYVCGWLNAVSRVVIRASQVAPLRLRVVDCCFAGGCWRRNEGLSEEGDGYEKKEAGLTLLCLSGFLWLRRLDSNERPPGYEPGELPTAPLRDVFLNSSAKVRLLEISSKFFADFFPFFEKCGVCGAVAGLSVWGVR